MIRFFPVIIVTGLIACAQAPAQLAKEQSVSQPQNGLQPDAAPIGEIALHPYNAGLQSVTIEVGGHERRFLFDTGGGLTIVSPGVAKGAGCLAFGRLTGHRMSGQRIDFMRCEGIAMKVGPLELQSRSVAVMDIGSLLPPDWPPVDGMISLETLREVPFTLDLAGGRIILETPQSLKVRVANMKSVPMRLSQVAGGASLDVFVMVPTQLGDAWMMLDTGNVDRVVLAPHTTHMLDLNLDADGVTKLPGQGGTPDRWELEEPIRVTGLPPVTTRIAVQEIIYDGNLGAAFVREFIFTFDIAQRKLWATPAAHMMRERSENQR